jgi:hypothetical protein
MRKFLLNRAACLALMCAALVLLAAALPANADTLYTTGGVPPTFLNNSGFSLGTGGNVLAESFVPVETATLTDAILPLEIFNEDPPGDVVKVFIESSSAGAPSGTVLDTLTTTGTIPTGSGQNLTFTCAVCSTLLSGTTYDIVVQQTAGADVPRWNLVSPATAGTVYLDAGAGPTSTSWTPFSLPNISAFEVDGTDPVAAPEPSSLLLLGVGLLALVAIGRKKFAADGLAQG